MQLIMLRAFDTLSSCGGGEISDPIKIGLREQDIEGKRGNGSNVFTIVGSVQPKIRMCMTETIISETAQIHGKEWGRNDGATMSLDSELDHNVVIVAHAHKPLR